MIKNSLNNNIFLDEKLKALKIAMNKDKLNLEEIKRKMEVIRDFSTGEELAYLNSLLDPKGTRGAKIPSMCNTPSCSFQLHNYITFKPVQGGLDVFVVNPFFLASDVYRDVTKLNINDTEYYLNSNVGLYFTCSQNGSFDGKTPQDSFYFPSAYQQQIPPVYNKYRLVSGCMEVKYVGELEKASGVIGGGVVFTKSNCLGGRLTKYIHEVGTLALRNPDYAKYGDFELIRDSVYFQENSCLEGLRLLYFPLDNSFLEFKKVFTGAPSEIISVGTTSNGGSYARITEDCFTSGFNWAVYMEGVPESEIRNFRVDFYYNYECLPNPEFLNYMPISLNMCHLTPSMIQKFVEEVQKNAIQKLNNFNLFNIKNI